MAGGRDGQDRGLLLNKGEIENLKGFLSIKGNAVVPLRIYFSEKNFAKILIGKAKGKKKFDKRQVIKEKDLDREAQREMKELVD